MGEFVFPLKESLTIISLDGFDVPENLKDRFLIRSWGGGSFCHGIHMWLDASKSPPSLTDPVGRCSEGPENLRIESGSAIFETWGRGNEGMVSTIYDGERVTERNAGLPEIGFVGNPYNPLDWVGVYTAIYFQLPENEVFLSQLLGWGGLNTVRFFSVATEFVEEGDWVVGYTCQQGSCNTDAAFVAISKSSGLPFIGYKRWSTANDETWILSGEIPNNIPNSVRGYIYGK